MKDLVIVRGAGDIATGVIQKLYRSGFKVIGVEIDKPTAIRRKVSLSEAIYEKIFKVEDVIGIRGDSYDEIFSILNSNKVCIVKDKECDLIYKLNPKIVVDATLSKKNIGTNKNMADITVALGPGYIAGKDVHLVIETNRGHNLGRLIFHGEAEKNTGIPGIIKGYGKERVIYAPSSGKIKVIKDIGSVVKKGDCICKISNDYVKANIDGLVRGMIRDEYYVKEGLKIGDIDPRIEEIENCNLISDKARCIGGAVLEGILILKNKGNI